jgi:hypothetical protein
MTSHRTAALALVLGLACVVPAGAQTTGGTGSTTAPSTTSSTTAPVGGDKDRDWGWIGLLGLLGLAGLRRPRDTTLGGTGTTRTGAR